MSITVFDNCRIFDGHGPDYIEDHRVVIEDGRIKALAPMSGAEGGSIQTYKRGLPALGEGKMPSLQPRIRLGDNLHFRR